MGVAKTADVWSYFLVDACLNTPRRTANKVVGWARGAKLAFETLVLLGRLNVADPFALTSGITVERLPLNSDDLDRWLPSSLGIERPAFLDRTILRIPCTIAPVFAKPSKVIDQGSSDWNIDAEIHSAWQVPLGGLHELTRALSLICNVAVERPLVWVDYGDHSHFYERNSSSYMGTGELPSRQDTEMSLTPKALKGALKLQPALCNPSIDVDTAINYWLKSKGRRVELENRLIFLRTALESLFLDKGFQGELSFRLAINGAWFTSPNSIERRKRFKLLKAIYAAASGAVHGQRTRRRNEGLLKEGQDICRQAIIKRLRSKLKPEWQDIVFGR